MIGGLWVLMNSGSVTNYVANSTQASANQPAGAVDLQCSAEVAASDWLCGEIPTRNPIYSPLPVSHQTQWLLLGCNVNSGLSILESSAGGTAILGSASSVPKQSKNMVLA